MKKIMMMAAIVCAAVSVHAASWAWSASGIATAGTTTGITATGAAYLFDAKLTTIQSVYSAFLNDTALTGATGYAGIADVSSGSINKTVNYGTAGNNYDFFFAVVDGDAIYFSNTLSNKPGADSPYTQISFGAQGVNKSRLAAVEGSTATVQRWNKASAAIPEPTSGLLMLIGLAGLALKRKQA